MHNAPVGVLPSKTCMHSAPVGVLPSNTLYCKQHCHWTIEILPVMFVILSHPYPLPSPLPPPSFCCFTGALQNRTRCRQGVCSRFHDVLPESDTNSLCHSRYFTVITVEKFPMREREMYHRLLVSFLLLSTTEP